MEVSIIVCNAIAILNKIFSDDNKHLILKLNDIMDILNEEYVSFSMEKTNNPQFRFSVKSSFYSGI